jgi:Short C-terminal domain
VGSLVGIAGVAFSITLMSRSMRSVEKIGGFCASGGPYQIAHPCPKGVSGLLPLSIFGGLIFLAVFAICTTSRGRSCLLLAWSALFLGLGWNFIDFGIVNPNGGNVSYGQLIPGILFIIMGAVPLVWVVPAMFRALLGEDDDSGTTTSSTGTGAPWASTTGVRFTSPTGTSTTPNAWSGLASTATPTMTAPTATTTPTRASSASKGDVASELEKLASLHRRGELTDTEYEDAKRRAIGGTT